MKSKVISTILNLKDNTSHKLVKVSKNVKNMSDDMKKAAASSAAFASRFASETKKIVASSAKLVGAGASVAGAFAFKTGLSEAMNLEGYRMQLETATKDTKKASKIMKYAVDLANKTPYEGGQLVEAAAKFESMGMAAKKWLPLAGDMAAATNKDYDQATEALIDAQTGELERLKEFGITKAMITEKAGKMFRGQMVVNNKGQIQDQEKFNEALVSLMKEKYAGGMEKQANTVKGMWSTVTGINKSALSTIAGMSSDGTIIKGSILAQIKSKLKSVSKEMERLQKSGRFDVIAKKVGAGFKFINKSISKTISFLKEYGDVFLGIGAGAVAFIAVDKVAKAFCVTTKVLSGAMKGLKVIAGLCSGTLALTPFGWITIAAVGLSAAFVVLWKRSETFRATVKRLWNTAKEFGIGLKSQIGPAMKSVGGWIKQNVLPAMLQARDLLVVLWRNVLVPFGIFVIATLKEIWNDIKNGTGVLGMLKNVAVVVFKVLKNYVETTLSVFRGLLTFLTGVFTLDWKKAWEGIKTIFKGVWDGIGNIAKIPLDWIDKKLDSLKEKVGKLGQKLTGIPVVGSIVGTITGTKKKKKNALGTPYFSGGLTSVHERGGEIIDLPSGTRIIPHDVSVKAAGRGNVVVYVTVQGNVIGNHQFLEEVGNYVGGKVIKALDNV